MLDVRNKREGFYLNTVKYLVNSYVFLFEMFEKFYIHYDIIAPQSSYVKLTFTPDLYLCTVLLYNTRCVVYRAEGCWVHFTGPLKNKGLFVLWLKIYTLCQHNFIMHRYNSAECSYMHCSQTLIIYIYIYNIIIIFFE